MYFNTLDLHIQSSTELYNGAVIAEFLASAEGSRISMQTILRNGKVFGGSLSNLNMVKSEIERRNKEDDDYSHNSKPLLNVYQIHSEKN
jgi:hypothetical protein